METYNPNDPYGFNKMTGLTNQFSVATQNPQVTTSNQMMGFDTLTPNPASVASPSGTTSNQGFDLLGNFLNTTDEFGNVQQGWGMPTIQAIGGLAQGILGFEQLSLAKDSFAFQKQAYAENMANQKALTNAQLEDRQNARNVQAGGQVQATDAYMKENGV